MHYKRVFLVGFMCSGKTTFGKLLSESLGWSFVDIDQEVERREGMPIRDIFEKKGEEYFRRLEFEILRSMAEKEKVVISTGGGLGASLEAMEFMKTKGLVVWLKIDFETFLERCGQDPSRPLLKRGKEELLRLFEKRSQVYKQASLILDGTANPKELVQKFFETCKGFKDIL
ncbi:MAG: shikimate kinase [Aquificaceae bacterium]